MFGLKVKAIKWPDMLPKRMLPGITRDENFQRITMVFPGALDGRQQGVIYAATEQIGEHVLGQLTGEQFAQRAAKLVRGSMRKFVFVEGEGDRTVHLFILSDGKGTLNEWARKTMDVWKAEIFPNPTKTGYAGVGMMPEITFAEVRRPVKY